MCTSIRIGKNFGTDANVFKKLKNFNFILRHLTSNMNVSTCALTSSSVKGESSFAF